MVVDCLVQRRADFVEGRARFADPHAPGRDIDILHTGAHLRGRLAERVRNGLRGRSEICGRFEQHRVAAGGFGVDLGVAAVLLDPFAKACRAGEVDDRGIRMAQQFQRRLGRRIVRDHAQQIRIVAGLGQQFAPAPDQQRNRQNRVRVRLQYHRIARRQVGHQRRVSVPLRKRGTAHHHGGAARHDPVMLLEACRFGSAEPAFPVRSLRHIGHRLPGIRERFQAAIEGIRATSRERHDVALPGSVHRRMGIHEQCQRIAPAAQHLEADTHALAHPGITPPGQRRARCREHRIDVRQRVADAKRLARERRDLGSDPAPLPRHRQLETRPQQRIEVLPAERRKLRTMNPRTRRFRIRRP